MLSGLDHCSDGTQVVLGAQRLQRPAETGTSRDVRNFDWRTERTPSARSTSCGVRCSASEIRKPDVASSRMTACRVADRIGQGCRLVQSRSASAPASKARTSSRV